MKRLLFAILLSACLLPSLPARAQFGPGTGGSLFGDRRDDIRIGAVARQKLKAYLQDSYARDCRAKKKTDGACAEQRPYYKGAFLPQDGEPLPADARALAGFVFPGTDHRQVGYSIYLIRLPDRKIYDVVSIWSDGWN